MAVINVSLYPTVMLCNRMCFDESLWRLTTAHQITISSILPPIVTDDLAHGLLHSARIP